MKTTNQFNYDDFNWKLDGDDLKVTFHFSADEFKFEPSLVFKSIDKSKLENKDVVDNLVFHIGLVEIFSYWKAFVSPKIVIKCGTLNSKQRNWWKDLVINGMGQFFFENKIDFTGNNFVEIVTEAQSDTEPTLAMIDSTKVLVPVGGGKDSSVTLALLKRNNIELAAFLLNPTDAARQTVEVAGVNSAVVVERSIDQKLLDLNKLGYPNGHTPFSALLSFISIFSSYLGNFGSVVFSNERSSDEENTVYRGMRINHQYSKTFEFENKFRQYNKKYLSNVDYFSFLRPLYDIQITKIFSNFPQYFSIIRSCNVGKKTNSWCGKCPKCLSTFILFKPFLKEKTIDIFGKDLLKDKSLAPLVESLTSEKGVKPFECVGTKKELRLAMEGTLDEALLDSWGENNLPGEFEKMLKEEL